MCVYIIKEKKRVEVNKIAKTNKNKISQESLIAKTICNKVKRVPLFDVVGPAKAKIKLADVDEQNMSITYEAVEGDILSDYNFFRVKFQASSNGENGSATVKWSIEFEKADENIPSAEANYLDFVSKLSMGLGAYLATN